MNNASDHLPMTILDGHGSSFLHFPPFIRNNQGQYTPKMAMVFDVFPCFPIIFLCFSHVPKDPRGRRPHSGPPGGSLQRLGFSLGSAVEPQRATQGEELRCKGPPMWKIHEYFGQPYHDSLLDEWTIHQSINQSIYIYIILYYIILCYIILYYYI